MADVVRDDNARRTLRSRRRKVFGNIAEKTDCGADDIEIVQICSADSRVFRCAERVARSRFRRRRDFADGASAHSARAEGDFFEKAVVDFAPLFSGDKFFNRRYGPRRKKTGGKPFRKVIFRILGNIAGCESRIDLVDKHHNSPKVR